MASRGLQQLRCADCSIIKCQICAVLRNEDARNPTLRDSDTDSDSDSDTVQWLDSLLAKIASKKRPIKLPMPDDSYDMNWPELDEETLLEPPELTSRSSDQFWFSLVNQ